jgi:hypothetical protein
VKHGEAEFTTSMARRNLFPRYDRPHFEASSSGVLVATSHLLQEKIQFDDRTYYHLKTKPDYKKKKYKPIAMPTTQLYFPFAEDKTMRLQAPEEQFLCAPVDGYVKEKLLSPLYRTQMKVPDELHNMSKETTDVYPDLGLFPCLHEFPPHSHTVTDNDVVAHQSLIHTVPAWLTGVNISYSVSESDLITSRPEYRCYKSYLPIVENDGLFAFRPCLEAQEISFHTDTSLRTQWINSNGGFQSVNHYFLGALDSHVKLNKLGNEDSAKNAILHDRIPECGPTLLDFYLPDHDRHVSGTYCFAKDHHRDIITWDADVRLLQHAQDEADHLTDSESDNEDCYIAEKPTMQKVRNILSTPIAKEEVIVDKSKKASPKKADKGKDKDTKTENKPDAKVEAKSAEEDEVLLSENERREEQVELLRDRKTLDLASQLNRQRKKRLEEVFDRCRMISKRGASINALEPSIPFHLYEENVYTHMIPYLPERSQVLVELDAQAMSMLQPPTSLSVTSLPPFSPMK